MDPDSSNCPWCDAPFVPFDVIGVDGDGFYVVCHSSVCEECFVEDSKYEVDNTTPCQRSCSECYRYSEAFPGPVAEEPSEELEEEEPFMWRFFLYADEFTDGQGWARYKEYMGFD